MGKTGPTGIPLPVAVLLLVGLVWPGSPLLADGQPEVEKSRYFTKTYTKAEMAAFRRPESITPFADQGTRFLTGILSAVGGNPEYMKGYRDNNDAIRRSNLQMRWAARDFKQEEPQSSKWVLGKLSKGVVHQTVEDVGNRTGVFRFRNGIDFKLDLSNPLGVSEAPPAPEPYRYGLVVEDIEPGRDGLLRAAMGEFRPEDLKYAGRSRVHWAVRPIQGNAGSQEDEQMFRVRNYAGEQPRETAGAAGGAAAPVATPATSAGSFEWRERLPRPAFRGSIKPSSGNPEQVAEPGEGLPPMAIGLEQVEGLYRMDYETGQGFKKTGVFHGLKVPLVGQMRLERRMNEKFEPSHTSLYGLQMVESRASVNLHKFDSDDLYVGEVKVGLEDAEVGFRRKKAISEDQNPEKNRYEISYTAGF